MRIGVLSDSHNYLDPQIPALLAGVEHILHAGDIGQPRLLWELEQIAPVTAVMGNTDDPGYHYRETEVLELAGRKFLLHHIVSPRALDDALQARIARVQPDVVVFGHTHKPFAEVINGIFFFNPGYVGKSRFGLERTLAILHCTQQECRPEYFRL